MRLTSLAKLIFCAAILLMPVLFSGYALAQGPVATTSDGSNTVGSGSSKKAISAEADASTTPIENKMMASDKTESMKTATFGAGCFWCVEAVFQRLEGVDKVVSGYMSAQARRDTRKSCLSLTTSQKCRSILCCRSSGRLTIRPRLTVKETIREPNIGQRFFTMTKIKKCWLSHTKRN